MPLLSGVQTQRKWTHSGSEADDKGDRLDFSERPSSAHPSDAEGGGDAFGSTADLTLKSRVDVQEEEVESDDEDEGGCGCEHARNSIKHSLLLVVRACSQRVQAGLNRQLCGVRSCDKLPL